MFDFEKMIRDSQIRAEEKFRKAMEAQQQLQPKQQQNVQQPPRPEQEKLAASTGPDGKIIASQKPIRAGELIPVNFTAALLVGRWKNSTCTDKVRVEFTITSVWGTKTWPGVSGSVRVFDRSQSDARVIDALVEGSFDPSGGFLAINATSPSPMNRYLLLGWDEMIQRRAPEMAQLRQEDFAARQAITLKYLFKQEEREQAISDFNHGRAKEIQAEIEKIHRVTSEKLYAEVGPIPLIPFRFDVARDAEGKGWAGTIESEILANCHEIQFVSEQGYTTEKLPPITGQAALERAASTDWYRPTPIAQAYWLHVAEGQADEKDFSLLGQVYDDQGRRDPQNYVRAFQYYRSALEKGEDARVQKGLGRLYAEGLGTAKNSAEAQRLSQLADKTNTMATKACTSPQSDAAIRSMIEHLYSKNTELHEVQAKKVSAIDKPFECHVKVKPNYSAVDIGNKVHSSVPDITYETTKTYKGGHSETTYSDNSLSKAMAGLAAMMLFSSGNEVVKDFFKVEPLSTLKYKITWGDFWHDSRNSSSRTVDLH